MLRDFDGLCTIIYGIVLDYMYSYTSNSVYLYKSIRASIFVFIQECFYNYKSWVHTII